jgi:hypothetical protein
LAVGVADIEASGQLLRVVALPRNHAASFANGLCSRRP